MKTSNAFFVFTAVCAFTLFIACTPAPPEVKLDKLDPAKTEMEFRSAMENHLDAVSTRDLERLQGTLSESGEMRLSLPSTETTTTVEDFMDFHEEWFKDTSWTFETRIVRTDVGPEIGAALVESIYREPLRNGVPYFNRMSISYVLKKEDGRWVVIADHASSTEKSTDQ